MAGFWQVLATLAWRNLWRNYRRTLIMLAAIALGVWAMIFLTAMLRGMVDDMVDGAINTLPGHVQIHHPAYRDDPSVANSLAWPDQDLLDALAHDLVTAWTARVAVPAMISSERSARGVTLLGIDPDSEQQMTTLAADITAGRYLEGVDDRGLIIGDKLAQRLETRLGKRVVLLSQDPQNNVADRGFRVVGIYKARLQSTEESFVYGARETVQNMLRLGSDVSEIAVLGAHYRDLAPLVEHLDTAGEGVEVLPWHQLNRVVGTQLGVMDGFVLVWMIVVFLALSFGLVNTLVMAVFERAREIGLMLALGMRPGAILGQILLESFFLLTLGLLLGDVLAWLSILPLRDGLDVSAVGEGMEMAGLGTVVHFSLQIKDIVLANTVVIVLGLAASLMPAWRAAHCRPVEALARN